MEITSVIFKTKDGDERASIIVRDISERKRAEKALGDSEAFTRTVMDNLPIGLAVNSVDPAVDFLYMNDNFPRFYRTTRKRSPIRMHSGMSSMKILFSGKKSGKGCWRIVPAATGHGCTGKMCPLPVREGRPLLLMPTHTPVPEKSLMISTVWDVTERKRAEDALLESETRYHSIFNFGADGIVIIDPDTATPVDFNQQACTQLGYTREEFGSLRISDIDLLEGTEEVKARIRKVINTGYDEFETVHRTKHGERRNVHVKAQYILAGGKSVYHGIWRDITERKHAEAEKEKLEAQLQQAKKMEAVGRLAGGVAHDFNNLLTVITGYSELLLQKLGKDPMHGNWRRSSGRGSVRRPDAAAAGVLPQADHRPKVVDLNELVADMQTMLRRLIGEDIALQIITGQTLGSVKVDPGQLEQVLMNLAVNARDAMPGGGRS